MKSQEKLVINDSDGRNYPFYGSTNQVCEIVGPKYNWSEHHITMRDLFHPWVPWYGPTNSKGKAPKLTKIERDQSFLVWLIALNAITKEIYVYKTVSWEMVLEINININRERGSRAELISDPTPRRPRIFKVNIPIPTAALYPPSANNAQVLIWRPRQGGMMLLVSPKFVVLSESSYIALNYNGRQEDNNSISYKRRRNSNDSRGSSSSAGHGRTSVSSSSTSSCGGGDNLSLNDNADSGDEIVQFSILIKNNDKI
ncbi:hypothetical protein GJ496_010924 [Pomphorhynchus laevis]|nr:hypothetical protein GJ496_010924 [Pomphorhynchus laevis]